MKLILTFIALFIFSSSIQAAAEEDNIFTPVSDLFLAVSNIDHDKMRAAVDDSFLLLEHGEVWTMNDFINAVNPSEFTRTNYFSVISSKVVGDTGFINYWNQANLKSEKKSMDVFWLESVVVTKVDGKWLVSQMHSTRLPEGKPPIGVTFVKQ
ncbi:hypothetical protein [Pseudoalteromonas sp. TB64]|uniref:hypothetical protein n=1 Tax=Pseudoalteromonas sp. TB64 TaxID=1938600 RepID=UPI0004166C21|nr:hypothetical protein [Pseudoalteromonas sp. TB64]